MFWCAVLSKDVPLDAHENWLHRNDTYTRIETSNQESVIDQTLIGENLLSGIGYNILPLIILARFLPL